MDRLFDASIRTMQASSSAREIKAFVTTGTPFDRGFAKRDAAAERINERERTFATLRGALQWQIWPAMFRYAGCAVNAHSVTN
jgi:hypothetical protein